MAELNGKAIAMERWLADNESKLPAGGAPMQMVPSHLSYMTSVAAAGHLVRCWMLLGLHNLSCLPGRCCLYMGVLLRMP